MRSGGDRLERCRGGGVVCRGGRTTANDRVLPSPLQPNTHAHTHMGGGYRMTENASHHPRRKILKRMFRIIYFIRPASRVQRQIL